MLAQQLNPGGVGMEVHGPSWQGNDWRIFAAPAAETAKAEPDMKNAARTSPDPGTILGATNVSSDTNGSRAQTVQATPSQYIQLISS